MRVFLRSLRPFLNTFVIVLFASVAIGLMWKHYLYTPWTRDGRVNAEVVAVAPQVADNVIEILVKDNQSVKKGDVLVRIDPVRYRLLLAQAEAAVVNRKHTMDERERQATRRVKLFTTSVISREENETSFSSAGEARSDYEVALAERDLAQLNLDRTTIRSPVNGYVTNLHLRVGDYATPGKPMMTLLDSDSLWVAAYMEETKLPSIHEGDVAVIKLMGISQNLRGQVDSISAGIQDENQANFAGFAKVNPIFNWVRLAQRIPVRIHFGDVPPSVRVFAGQTCTVVIEPGDKSLHD